MGPMQPLLWLLLSLASCAPSAAPSAAPPPPPAAPDAAKPALDAFIEANRVRYTTAIAGARAFLDALDVDPAALRARRIKGKKKLVEALDAYYRLYQISPPTERAKLLARIASLAKPTTEAAYHDMLTVDDHAFNEDATSYLRAALLLDRMGLDITLYRRAIEAVKSRLDAHMKERGPHQRRAFHTYYQHFGLTEPFPLEGALEQGLIARRADPGPLGRMDAYALTHEVFAAYAFGDDLDARPFTGEDRAYLRAAFGTLGERALGERDSDLVAEIVTCLRLLRMTGEPRYTRGIAYLLDAQNADGSWGSYEPLRARLGDLVKQAFYLHTTMVAIDALTLAFEPMFRRGEGPQ
jgi:hypothetical protein